jgi:hypothetical protein
MKLRKADTPQDFSEAIKRRPVNTRPVEAEELAENLLNYFNGVDYQARRAANRAILTVYANYENKYFGEVDELTGTWHDEPLLGNEVNFSVPLFRAHVDTGITFYSKAKPQYEASPRVRNYQLEALAEMCEAVSSKEYQRMMTPEVIQREAQYLFLAGQSFRQIYPAVSDESPLHVTYVTKTDTVTAVNSTCLDCGYAERAAMEQCPQCLSTNIEVAQSDEEVTYDSPVAQKLPRPQVSIPNPISIQTDFSAPVFRQSSFVIKRRLISKQQAEYYYGVDLEGTFTPTDFSADVLDRQAKEPQLGNLFNSNFTDSFVPFSSYFNSQTEKVQEVEMFLDPCEYSLYSIKTELLMEKFPDGVYIHIVGDRLVEMKPSKRTREWIGLVCGRRPSASGGFGMMHLAEMNDLINNAVNLEYSIARTCGFPLTLIRSRYLKEVPQALQTVLLDNLPDDVSLDDVVTRLSSANPSGILGVLTGKFEGWMQFAGATWSATGGAADARDMMGTATGALAVQEMMNDRLGLAVQARVQADIETHYSILEYIQADKSEANMELLSSQFDAATVKMFFEADIRSLIRFTLIEGTEEPKSDSVSTLKAQVFAQMTASLSNLSEIDKAAYLDIISTFGDSLGLPVEVGKGRKEKNLAQNRIRQVETMYKDMSSQGLAQDEMQMAGIIAQQILSQDQVLFAFDPSIELTLYDYEALCETYSDWLQSNDGQNSQSAVRGAVALLYSYAQKVQMAKEDQEFQMNLARQTQAAVYMAQAGGVTPPALETSDEDDPEEEEGEMSVGR